jgi:hypothetical protein
MSVVMLGQGHDRIPGPEEHSTAEGWDDGTACAVADQRPGTALAVRSRESVVRPAEVAPVVTPELLADLHDPSLVISHGYVGPDRRRVDRSAPPAPAVPQWLHRILVVVFMTALVVTPLTLIAARSVPPAATSPEQGQSSTSPHSGTGKGPGRATKHVFTASTQEVARAEAAYQRALARVAGAGTGSGPTARTASAGPSGSAAPSAASQATVQRQVQQQAGQTAAADQRTAAQAQAAQARAAAQAVVTQRRAAQAAARAQARAARSAARGAGSGPEADGPPSGGPSAGPVVPTS